MVTGGDPKSRTALLSPHSAALVSEGGLQHLKTPPRSFFRRKTTLLGIGLILVVVLCLAGFVVYNGLQGGDPAISTQNFLPDINNDNETLSEDDTQILREKGFNLTLEFMERLQKPKSWSKQETNSHGEVFYTGRGINKHAFRITGKLPGTPAEILRVTFFDIESLPEYQKESAESKIVKKIDNNTIIVYQRTFTVAGLVSARQFISINYWRELENDEIVIVAQSIEWPHNSTIDDAEAVWGHVVMAGVWMRPDPENPGNSNLDQILEINLGLPFFPFKEMIFADKLNKANEGLRQKMLQELEKIKNNNNLIQEEEKSKSIDKSDLEKEKYVLT